MSKRPASFLDPHQKAFVKLVQEVAQRYRVHEVFRDFCELAALSFSNVFDRSQYAEREARYMQIIKRYEHDEINKFAQMLAHVRESLECGFADCLGQLFMALDLGDHWRGQFFTPYEVSYMMAKMSLHGVRDHIEKKGYFTVNEPACGAGAMVIACAHSLKDDGINYQQHMHVIAEDIDITAVHMAYIQLTLFHVPAIVLHGNSLKPSEVWSVWRTGAHVLGFWDAKLARHRREEKEAAQAQQAAAAPAAFPLLTPDRAAEIRARREAALRERMQRSKPPRAVNE